jgi:hypothetical protein
MVASTDDDGEQTRSARLPSWSKGRAALGVGAALLLLGAMACFSQGGAAKGDAMDSMILSKGGAAQGDAMDSILQSRAVAEHGRVLTEDELVEVRGFAEKVPDNHLRTLYSQSPISVECQSEVSMHMAEATGKLLNLVLDKVFKCSKEPPTSTSPNWACQDAQSKVNTFDKDQTDDCRDSKNYCTVVEHGPFGGTEENPVHSISTDVCSPQACHVHKDMAQNVYTALLKVKYPWCSECSVDVACGD